MINGIHRHNRAPAQSERFSCVRVHIEVGEVTARDVDTDPVALLEQIGCRIQLGIELVDLTRRQMLLLGVSAILRPQNAVCQVHLESGGIAGIRRVGVDQFRGEIGTYRRGRGEDVNPDWSRHSHVRCERSGLINQDVRTRLQRQIWRFGAEEAGLHIAIERTLTLIEGAAKCPRGCCPAATDG